MRDNLSEGREAIYHFHAVPREGEGQKSNLDCHKAVGNMRMLWVQNDYCFTKYWVILTFL